MLLRTHLAFRKSRKLMETTMRLRTTWQLMLIPLPRMRQNQEAQEAQGDHHEAEYHMAPGAELDAGLT